MGHTTEGWAAAAAFSTFNGGACNTELSTITCNLCLVHAGKALPRPLDARAVSAEVLERHVHLCHSDRVACRKVCGHHMGHFHSRTVLGMRHGSKAWVLASAEAAGPWVWLSWMLRAGAEGPAPGLGKAAQGHPVKQAAQCPHEQQQVPWSYAPIQAQAHASLRMRAWFSMKSSNNCRTCVSHMLSARIWLACQ